MLRLAVLGDPIAHSRSPAIHNAALTACGLQGEYQARQVDAAGVRQAFAELRSGALTGFNVTMPHKSLAASLCDRLSPEAERAGSVNTVLLEGAHAFGTSTDVGGIQDAWGDLPREGPVLILGAGGAAAAAAIALEARPLYLSARRPGSGRELGARLGIDIGEIKWGAAVAGAVVVNCTPLGMHGESLPEEVVDLGAGLFDMAYGEGRTPATKRVLEAGKPAVEGLDLLVSQAARSFTLWTGLPAPIEVMKQAAGNP